MEVSGRRTSNDRNLSLSRGSEDDFELSCQPCAAEGHHVEAEGFCQNCQEYLCTTCYKYHCKPTPTRHHVLLDKYNMPKNKAPSSAKYGCTLTCTKHASEIVKFFCKQHDAVGCGDCMVLDHKSCKTDYIPDISKDFIDGEEYVQLVTRAKQLENNAKSLKKEIEEDGKEVYRLYAKAVGDIRAFRKQVDKYLEDMEQKLLDQCESQKTKADRILKAVENQLQPMKRELEDIQSQLTSQARHSGDLFVQAKQISFRLKKIGEELKFLDEKNEPSMYTFEKNNQILEYFQTKQGSLGDLRPKQIRNRQVMSPRRLQDLTPTVTGEVSAKSSTDEDSWITGMVAIAPDTLVCTNCNNHSVKLINIKSDKITSELKLTAQPWDITYVSYDQLAVTVTEEKKICFLSFRNGLSKIRDIAVNGKCDGIAYSKYRLVVSYISPPKVEILSLDGKVIQRIDTDSSGKALFDCPWYVAVDRDGNCIYVSDTRTGSVTKVTTSGKVLDTYKDTNLSCPTGIAVYSDGSVLVCNYGNDNLHLLSSENKKIKTILNTTEGPQALCFNTDLDSLFLSCLESKRETVFKYKLT
ncbi:tripartite motif-containing protein 66-like [Mercenaria mercenaria]|uniref:tripartite motif-containing protein 66-like n=1 Tax=Mercenaria mercenaria TaxID=6596 RepID=UPI00234FB002|nr:tripartite motif-containing protein 66-like [Mercenaria mercenaria]